MQQAAAAAADTAIPSLHISVKHSLRFGCRTSKRSALDCSLGSSGAGSGSACSSTSAVSVLSFLSRANAGLLEFSFRVGGPCVLALAALSMVPTGHGPYQFLFPAVAMLVFARSNAFV